jgi:hypothetical protein
MDRPTVVSYLVGKNDGKADRSVGPCVVSLKQAKHI